MSALLSVPPDERGDRAADVGRRVLLDEVRAPDGDLLLVGPVAAELALSADEDGAGLRIDEELRHGAHAQPRRVARDDAGDVGGNAPAWGLPRPRPGRAA